MRALESGLAAATCDPRSDKRPAAGLQEFGRRPCLGLISATGPDKHVYSGRGSARPRRDGLRIIPLNMIHELGAVEGAQLADQIAYLHESDVAWVARALLQGDLRLLKSQIRSRTFLGGQRTIFSTLGGIRARARYGRDKFLVENVYEVLHDDRCSDSKSRNRADAMIKAATAGDFAPNITIVRGVPGLIGDEDPMIVDGNKTAVAFHHVHSSADAIAVAVFVAEGIR